MTKLLANAANARPASRDLNASLPECLTAVPEVCALEGTAAIAPVAAIVLFAWERSRNENG